MATSASSKKLLIMVMGTFPVWVSYHYYSIVFLFVSFFFFCIKLTTYHANWNMLCIKVIAYHGNGNVVLIKLIEYHGNGNGIVFCIKLIIYHDNWNAFRFKLINYMPLLRHFFLFFFSIQLITNQGKGKFSISK